MFTPTYNRAHTLERTYQSMIKQDYKDFVWLIIDDGSTDNTKEMVDKWMSVDNGFSIRYIYKKNGGMHTAHNVAYENIDTELNVCVDSDDCLSVYAVRRIMETWEKVKDKGYAGLIALDADMNTGKVIGTGFPEGMKETSLVDYYSKGGKGDKKLIYRTDVVKKYPPYPTFEGENYVGLVYLYRLIDQDYKLAVLNEVVCEVEYLPDGSSGTMFKQYLRNPKGFAFWRRTAMQYPDNPKRLFIECIHYVSSSLLAHNKHFISESPRKLLTVLAVPFGVIWTIYIKRKANER